MANDKQQLINLAKTSAQTFHDTMIALGYLFTEEERREFRRLIPLREYVEGVDTIDSIRGRTYLPVLMATAIDDVFSGKSKEEDGSKCGCGCN